MFQILILEDKLKLLPDQFSRDVLQVLEEQIEAKYCNKILYYIACMYCKNSL